MTNRGVNLGSHQPIDNQALVAAGAKLSRWILVYVDYLKVTTDAEYAKYRMVIDQQLDEIIADKILPGRIICLYHPPGKIKYSNNRWKLWFYETWKHIATKLKGQDRIYGYDLLNEPNAKSSDLERLYQKTAEKIHVIDPNANIIGSSKHGLPSELKNMKPVKGIGTYTVHFWQPLDYTHQGVYPEFPYPEPYNDSVKIAVKKDIDRVKAWQNKYHKKILIGEFGVARWSPNAKEFLQDMINQLRLTDWDWCEHGYRGAHMWDQEFSSNFNDGSGEVRTNTDRWQIIKEGFNN